MNELSSADPKAGSRKQEAGSNWPVGIRLGSLHELETLPEITKQIGYLDDASQENATALADEVGKMLWMLIKKLGTRHWK